MSASGPRPEGPGGWTNGWTGGQYSLFRVLFGAYLAVHFARLVPYGAELFSSGGAVPDGSASPLLVPPNVLYWFDAPGFVTALLAAAVALSALFAAGWRDRFAAVALWYVLACLFGRNPLIANPGLPYVGWLLLAHAFLPPAPYGSVAARGRIDPGGGWRMPQGIFAAAWILMALGYTYSGAMKLTSPSWLDGTALLRVLENPLARDTFLREWALALPAWIMKGATWGALGLELLFAPLALLRRLRPLLWTAALAMHLSLMGVIDFADLTLGMVMLHLFTFNPAWVPPLGAARRDLLLYDGTCGLCHRAVRFLLAEDAAGRAFRFAPLQGAAIEKVAGPAERAKLPDSIVVATAEGALLTRSAAFIRLLSRLGGYWRLLAIAVRIVPRPLRDALYAGISRIRYRLFPRPADTCPLLPPHLRERFDA